MNKTKLAVYGSIALILLSVLTFIGIELFRSKEIYTYSFDRSELYVLADYKTTFLYENSEWDANLSTRFSVRKTDDFIDKVVTPHDDLVMSYPVLMGYPSQQIIFYYFEHNGQIYYLHVEPSMIYDEYENDAYNDGDDMFIFGPAYAIVDQNGTIIRFPFPFPDYFMDKGELVPWRDIPSDEFSSYEDFKVFYELYDDEIVQFDDDVQIITLRTSVFDYGIDDQVDGLSTKYLIQLQFTSSGFVVNLLDID